MTANDGKGAVALGEQIRVRQDDAFRVARGAGGVENDRGIRRARTARRDRRRRQVAADHGVEGDGGRVAAVQEDDSKLDGGGFPGRDDCRQVLRRREHHACGRVDEQRLHLRRLVAGVERHRDGAAAENAEVGRAPGGVVVGEDRGALAGLEADHREPGGRPLGHLAKPRVRHLFQAIAMLDFNGDVVGELVDGGGDELVEVLHARAARA